MILLDTNVLIVLMAGADLRPEATAAIRTAAPNRAVLVSATTAWEIGLLATRTGRTARIFEPDGRTWFVAATRLPGNRVLQFDDAMALDASYLPGNFHRDPSDRWLVASARIADVPLLTPDRAILAYAAAGHVRATAACSRRGARDNSRLAMLTDNMVRSEVTATLRAHADRLRAVGVGALYLFGSTARDEAGPASDIDLFFDPADVGLSLFDVMDLRDEIAGLLHSRVDVMTRSSLHPYLRGRIEAEAVHVF